MVPQLSRRRSSWQRWLAVVLMLPTIAVGQSKLFRLAPLFTDNAVVQQKSLVPLWGLGTPGTMVKVSASWHAQASTVVQKDSTWMLKVHTPRAGGPYEIAVHHDDTVVTLRNVLVGEVWLCSGQSNMEMPLAGWPPNDTVMYSQDEIRRSANTNFRMFTVRRAYSAQPEFSCVGEWLESSPANAGDFSATAYFFGKKLYESLHVPIGLIHSSWGGTRIESWIGATFLSKLPGYDSTLQRVHDAIAGQDQLKTWLHGFPTIDMRARKGDGKWSNLTFQDQACAARGYDDADWRTMNLPTVWENTEVGSFDGVVWFRRQVKIPPAWVHTNLTLELGPIDDIDVTYVNGVIVGSHEGQGQWNVDRTYQVPAAVVDSTLMQIAVRVIDYGGGGGIYGKPQSMVLRSEQAGEPLMLSGPWKYVPVADYEDYMFYVFGPIGNHYGKRPRLAIDLSADTPTSLYNGMIAPLVPYAIRGTIWYQGESNTGNPEQYKKLFPLLIDHWRSVFHEASFPFYYAQIAPYDYGKSTHSELLREAQCATLSVAHTGMAVLLDIGNPKNIHPTNKQDVGARLALWALAKTYNKNLAYSGPFYKSLRRLKGKLELAFDHVGGGLVLTGGMLGNGFEVAGADRVFKPAIAEVHGKKLMVYSPDVVDPVAVRYAFSNTPAATLFNTDGLPASSFRTDDWK